MVPLLLQLTSTKSKLIMQGSEQVVGAFTETEVVQVNVVKSCKSKFKSPFAIRNGPKF